MPLPAPPQVEEVQKDSLSTCGEGWGGEGLAQRFASASACIEAKDRLMGNLGSTQIQSAHCRSSLNPTTPDQGWLPMRPVAGAPASPKPSSQASAPSKFS